MSSRFGQNSVTFIIAVGYIAAFLSCLWRLGYPFELLVHFWFHGMVLSLILVLLCAFIVRLRLAFAAGVLFLFFSGVQINSWNYVTPSFDAETTNSITIVWTNIDRKEAAIKSLFRQIKGIDADIIAFGELPLELTKADLTALAPEYSHVWISSFASTDHKFPSRIAVLSRIQVNDPQLKTLPQTLQPRDWFIGNLGVGDSQLSLSFAHSIAPDYPGMVKDRNIYLDHVSSRLLERDEGRDRFVLIGDLNVTPWAPQFARLPGQRVGNPRSNSTWLSRLPLLGLPLDHVMIGNKISVESFNIGHYVGSDHLPIIVKIAW